MSDIMRQIPFQKLVNWMLNEYETEKSVFGVRQEKFYKNENGKKMEIFGDKLGSPIGPAAGPSSQLAQNILASFLAGSRFVELKTVQIMDGEALRKCVAKPCINVQDEGYNVEWSTELTVEEAYGEYIKAWFLLHIANAEFELSAERDFVFNMSVGYNLEGIQSKKIDTYIENLKDASKTEIWRECYNFLQGNISLFKNFSRSDLEKVSPVVSPSIALSTLHGCPKEEIERIATYLLTEKKLHTYIKCNPTLLGYEYTRGILDELGYEYISFDQHHFENDLNFNDAIEMLKRLLMLAEEKGLCFGVKLTNTFPVQIKASELPGEEMYMSGRALFPLSISVAYELSEALKGRLPISYSGGADFFNIDDILKTGIQPVTVATTILKPGGYERLTQLAIKAEQSVVEKVDAIDVKLLVDIVNELGDVKQYQKEYRSVKSRKTAEELPMFSCAKSPCSEGGCPINQQIPAYIKMAGMGNFDVAFKIIAIDNTAPSITGEICNHKCQSKCTRLDYEAPLNIRNLKKISAEKSQESFIDKINPAKLRTDRKAVVIGAGPAGIAAALFLRRNGVEVEVLEKREKPYGIVNYVIPDFRIAEAAIERDYRLAEKTGVNFEFGVNENYNIQELKKGYDFIILATGAWEKGNCGLKSGEENLTDALEFLEKFKLDNKSVDLGKSVAVLGGGNVAMDCARAAKRVKGVEKVSLVYRRTKEFMPADLEEIKLAIEEDVEILELLAPISYENKELCCEVMELGEYDQSSRRSIKSTGENKTFTFDSVISAIGAKIKTDKFVGNGIELNERGYVKLNGDNESSEKNVYIIGDCRKGPDTIVGAIADAKAVAKSILQKLDIMDDFAKYLMPADYPGIYLKKGSLIEPSETESDAVRCLECDIVCEICCDVCPNRANKMIEIKGSMGHNHQILHIDGMCNECGNCSMFCPYVGDPYKNKFTLFWSLEDFEDSKNSGFVKTGDNEYKVRNEDSSIAMYPADKNRLSEDINCVIQTIEEGYNYLLV